jgi:hypothetical protein
MQLSPKEISAQVDVSPEKIYRHIYTDLPPKGGPVEC